MKKINWGIIGLGNIANLECISSSNYYTSSQVNANHAWRIFCRNGVWTYNLGKSNAYNVRAVRAF